MGRALGYSVKEEIRKRKRKENARDERNVKGMADGRCRRTAVQREWKMGRRGKKKGNGGEERKREEASHIHRAVEQADENVGEKKV